MPTGRASDVALFADWCAATDRDPATVTWTDTLTFLRDCPTSARNRRRRATAAVAVCAHAGNHLTHPDAAPRTDSTLVRPAPALTLTEALPRIPVRGWMAGFIGRRDSFVLTAGALGLTRKTCRSLTDLDLTWGDSITINGRRVPTGDNVAACPACRVWLWVQARAAAAPDAPESAPKILVNNAPPVADDDHTCRLAPPTPPAGNHLTVGIDRHGNLTSPLHPVSITRIFRTRLDPDAPTRERNDWARQPESAAPRDEPFRRELFTDLDELLDSLEDQVEASADRVRGIVDELLAEASKSTPGERK